MSSSVNEKDDQQSKLQPHLISGIPKAIYYLPNFITAEEEASILAAIHDIPTHRWTVLSHRRLLSLPSQLTGTKRATLIQATLPPFLQDPILHRFRTFDVFETSPHLQPNHCLVNEYQPGQGIMPHEDGPAYFPITATVSLGSHTVLDIYEKGDAGAAKGSATWRILQEPRSLLVTTQEAYEDTLHGIQAVSADHGLRQDDIANWNLLGDDTAYRRGETTRTTRVSLTYRDVLKVSDLGGAIKFIRRM